MTLILDTRGIPAADRADAVRDTIRAAVVPVEITFPGQTTAAAAYGTITALSGMTVCSVRSNAITVERTPRLARDDLAPSIFLGVQPAGSSLIVQGGRETVLRPGDLAFSESTTPYTLADGDGVRQHFFCIPMDELGLPHDLLRRTAAVRLSPGHPLADLTSAYLERLGARPGHVVHPGAHELGRPTIDLVRALITTHVGATAPARDALDATLSLRILEYLRAHLGDPGLNAAQVAAAHHISVRHLYNVLARDGIALGDWIRRRRLERCRDELARPGTATIGAIARRWGFRDASSFGRLFRATYGLSPREWRDAARDSVV